MLALLIKVMYDSTAKSCFLQAHTLAAAPTAVLHTEPFRAVRADENEPKDKPVSLPDPASQPATLVVSSEGEPQTTENAEDETAKDDASDQSPKIKEGVDTGSKCVVTCITYM